MVFTKEFEDIRAAVLFAEEKSSVVVKKYDWDNLKGLLTFYEVSYKINK